MPGGKGINVASSLAVFGEEVVATGFLGGQTCQAFEEFIRRAGVSTSFIYTDQEMRTDFYVIEEGKADQTMVIEDGSPVKKHYISSFMANFDRLLSIADVIEIGGSLPCGLEPKFVKDLILKARAKGKKVVLDLREPILKECLDVSGIFIVKPDVREKKRLFGNDLGDEKVRMGVVDDLLSKGSEIVILNYRKLNYLVASKSERYDGGIEYEESGVLIGVQDGMLAGFLHNYLKTGNIEDAFKYGLAAGLATERGKKNFPESRDQVEKLLPLCKVRKVG
jgi:1-phosphofructokinase family hexose kinase